MLLGVLVAIALFGTACKKALSEPVWVYNLPNGMPADIAQRALELGEAEGVGVSFSNGMDDGTYWIWFEKGWNTASGSTTLLNEFFLKPFDQEMLEYVFEGKNPKQFNCAAVVYTIQFTDRAVEYYSWYM